MWRTYYIHIFLPDMCVEECAMQIGAYISLARLTLYTFQIYSGMINVLCVKARFSKCATNMYVNDR
jgi:hypothetical protein